MPRLIPALLLLPLSFLLVGCPARPRPLDQPRAIFAEGAWAHDKSGMTFPIAVGDFQRGTVQRYDQEGLDVSVGYNLFDSRRQIIATVFVYPAPSLVSIGSPTETVASAQTFLAENEFETRKREILQTRPGAQVIEDTEISIPIDGTVRIGRIATFEYEEKFSGRQQPLRSHLCMFNFVGGKWAIKYRITYPKSLEATHEIDVVLQGVPWNVPKD